VNHLPAPEAHCSAGSKVRVQDGSRLHALQLGEDVDQPEKVDLLFHELQVLFDILKAGTSGHDSAHERRARIGCGNWGWWLVQRPRFTNLRHRFVESHGQVLGVPFKSIGNAADWHPFAMDKS
jgi:hypothetical protein